MTPSPRDLMDRRSALELRLSTGVDEAARVWSAHIGDIEDELRRYATSTMALHAVAQRVLDRLVRGISNWRPGGEFKRVQASPDRGPPAPVGLHAVARIKGGTLSPRRGGFSSHAGDVDARKKDEGASVARRLRSDPSKS